MQFQKKYLLQNCSYLKSLIYYFSIFYKKRNFLKDQHQVRKQSFLVLLHSKILLKYQDFQYLNLNLFFGLVSESIFQGESQLLVLRLDPEVFGEQSLQMRIANGSDLKGKIPAVGEKISIGFNATYLKEAITNYPSEEILFVFKDELSATLLLPKTKNHKITILLMPVRINE